MPFHLAHFHENYIQVHKIQTGVFTGGQSVTGGGGTPLHPTPAR